MFEKIRKKIGRYYLRKEQARFEHEPRLLNLKQARKIGILYTLNDVPDYEKVSEFVSELQFDHKDVKALGFVRNINLISRFLPKLSFDFFSRKDLTWFYKPIHNKVKDFIEKDFDLLINLSLTENFPLKYISGLSRSFCRVGTFSEENTSYYDLMIEIKPSTSLDEYLGQIRYYLTIINTNAERK